MKNSVNIIIARRIVDRDSRGPTRAYMAIHVPGHKSWVSQIHPWEYTPAHTLILEITGKGLKWAESVLDIPARRPKGENP